MHLFQACAFVAKPDGRIRTPLHKLEKHEVLAAWKETERATEQAIGLIRAELGLVNMGILWSGALVVPVIALCATTSPRQRDSKGLMAWLALAALTHRYGGSSSTKLDEDLKACREPDPIGALLTNLRQKQRRPDLAAQPSDFSGALADRSGLLALYIACMHRGILNFYTGEKVILQNAVDRHHILPRGQFPDSSRASADNIANIAFIVGDVNKSISQSGPEVYLKQIESRVLISQCIPDDQNLWAVDRAEEFWSARRQLLADSFNDFLRASLPGRRLGIWLKSIWSPRKPCEGNNNQFCRSRADRLAESINDWLGVFLCREPDLRGQRLRPQLEGKGMSDEAAAGHLAPQSQQEGEPTGELLGKWSAEDREIRLTDHILWQVIREDDGKEEVNGIPLEAITGVRIIQEWEESLSLHVDHATGPGEMGSTAFLFPSGDDREQALAKLKLLLNWQPQTNRVGLGEAIIGPFLCICVLSVPILFYWTRVIFYRVMVDLRNRGNRAITDAKWISIIAGGIAVFFLFQLIQRAIRHPLQLTLVPPEKRQQRDAGTAEKNAETVTEKDNTGHDEARCKAPTVQSEGRVAVGQARDMGRTKFRRP